MIRVGPMFIAWSERRGRGKTLGQGGGDIWECDEHLLWSADEMGSWPEWYATALKWGWSQQKAASWWARSPAVHARLHGLDLGDDG